MEFSAFFTYPLAVAQSPHPKLLPLFHHQIRFDRPSISHVLVCLIDFIQRIAVREDFAGVDVTVQNGLQENFLVIGCHRSRTAGKRDVSVERFCRIHLGAMRQADAADEAAGTNDAECLVGRALGADAFEDG